MFSFLISVLKIFFVLGFLVFIHEGGHFLAARLFKVKVEEFSIGFGPKLFRKKGKETEYSISAIPFGGYVRMLGEEQRVEEDRAFNKAKIWHRIIIVAAGALVNIMFAIIIYFMLSLFSGQNVSTTVSNIIPEYAENISGIEVGDKILEINNSKIRIKSDILKALRNSNGEKVKILVERSGKQLEFEVLPTEYAENVYILGIEVALENGTFKDKCYYAFWETVDFVLSIGNSLKMLFSGKISADQMTGPIGISQIVVKTSGVYDFVYLLSLISLSLGITNLLPIPALDGGRIVLLIIEGIRGKALSEEVELGIQSIGFSLLILLSLYVSYNDILRIF